MLDALSNHLRLYSLKQRLRFWVGCIIAVLGLLVLHGIYFMEVKSQTARTNGQLKGALELQSAYFDAWFEEHSSQIRFLSYLLSNENLDELQMDTVFRSFLASNKDFTAVVMADARGKIVMDSGGPSGGNISDRIYYQEAVQGKEFITDIILSKNTGKPMVLVSAPFYAGSGEFAGLVFGSISIQALCEQLDRFKHDHAGQAYLLDRTGRFITGPLGLTSTSQTYKNDSPIYKKAAQGLETRGVYKNYAGQKVFGQYTWTKKGEWLLVAELSCREVFKPLYKKMLLIAGMIVLFLAFSYLLMIFLTRGVERSIGLLLHASKLISDGNYQYRLPEKAFKHAPREVRILGESFNNTAQRLQSTIRLLEDSAIKDQLTNVYNRRFILSRGTELLADCKREQQDCTLLLLDIDFFKRINDSYGHLVGDRVILYAASLLLSCLRPSDLAARYGGEEFLILLPRTNAVEGGGLAEQICRAFKVTPYQENGIRIEVTVSIGVSASRQSNVLGRSVLEDMIFRADQAMYQAKRQGRNRVVLAAGYIGEYEQESGE